MKRWKYNIEADISRVFFIVWRCPLEELLVTVSKRRIHEFRLLFIIFKNRHLKCMSLKRWITIHFPKSNWRSTWQQGNGLFDSHQDRYFFLFQKMMANAPHLNKILEAKSWIRYNPVITSLAYQRCQCWSTISYCIIKLCDFSSLYLGAFTFYITTNECLFFFLLIGRNRTISHLHIKKQGPSENHMPHSPQKF